MRIPIIIFIFIFTFLACFDRGNIPDEQITRIAFGSCGHQDKDLPVFDLVVDHQADYFIFLGDNIYGDTKDMEVLKEKYGKLAAKKPFQNMKENVKILATWDDHDYGWNDSGRHYPFKKESKEIFLDFFEEEKDSERRQHEGIYHSYMLDQFGKKVQIILLDNRTFRDDLIFNQEQPENYKHYFYKLDYAIQQNQDSTILGADQWKWLEKELNKEADMRIIGNGSQFAIEYNGYEAWANFPHEQRRMLDLIKKTKAEGVLFITGDVHYAEISKIEEEGLYPIYDVTASGLSETWSFATPNKNRIEGPVMDNHFGMLSIDWSIPSPSIKMEVWDVRDNQRIEYTLSMDELKF